MRSKQNKQLVPLARNLRKNMTKEERRLWYDYLRDHPMKFTRQKVLGNTSRISTAPKPVWSLNWTAPSITSKKGKQQTGNGQSSFGDTVSGC